MFEKGNIMTDNIFDLSKRTVNKKESTEITPEDRERLLEGYIEIPYEQWDGIKRGWHIRYERKGGIFRKGGYADIVWKKTDTDGNILRYIKMTPIFYKRPGGYRKSSWIVSLDTLDRIWKKASSNGEMAPADQNSLKQEVDILKKEVARLKKDLVWLKALVVKLHNLKLVQPPQLNPNQA